MGPSLPELLSLKIVLRLMDNNSATAFASSSRGVLVRGSVVLGLSGAFPMQLFYAGMLQQSRSQ